MQANLSESKGKGIFRYKEDFWPVIVILLLTLIDFVMYFVIDNIMVFAVYYLIMIIPKGVISAWNHHHQHIFTFRNNSLNRILEFFYALHTGVTTHLWRLHHVLGHHLNFLDQEKDESRWQDKQGNKMGPIAYTLNVALTAYPRGFRVGKRYPKQMKPFLVFSFITFVGVALLVWFKPVAGIFLFVLPMITSLLFTSFVTYFHHAGLDSKNEFEASYNNLNPMFNFFTGNLGYHTAHHHKQGVHWSKLPALHETIADKIPDSLFQESIITQKLFGSRSRG